MAIYKPPDSQAHTLMITQNFYQDIPKNLEDAPITAFKIWGGYFKAAAEQRVGDFSAQGLANTAWAFATAGQSDALLFMTLARASERHVGDFSAQELANTAWAFAIAGQSDALLFMMLGRAAERHMDDFNVQDLTNTA